MAELAAAPDLLSIKRWPVRWRIAGVSAGAHAADPRRLRARRRPARHRPGQGRLPARARNARRASCATRSSWVGIDAQPVRTSLNLLMTGDAACGSSTGRRRRVATGAPQQTAGAPNMGAPEPRARCGGRPATRSSPCRSRPARSRRPICSTRATASSLEATLSKLWLFLGIGVVGGTALAALAGLAVAGRAMRPISSLTAAAREIATTRDPSRRIPMPESDDEVAELARTLEQMLRELDAARSETEADDPGAARLRRRRLARAAHAADEHPRQPRAARGEPRRARRRPRGGGDRRRGARLVAPHAPPGRRPAAARPRRRRTHRPAATLRPGRGRDDRGRRGAADERGPRDRARGGERRSRSRATPTTCTGWSSTWSRTAIRHTPSRMRRSP